MERKILIIGGGVIGLSIAWQILRNGKYVEIYDRGNHLNSASWVSAGMLAPYSEAYFEELNLFNLCKESFLLYPKFLRELEEDSGRKLMLDKCGSLIVGFNRDDVERMRRLYNFYENNNFPVTWLDGDETRQIEPLLSSRTIASIWIPEEGQIDNRKLVELLKIVIHKFGGKIFENTQVNEIKIHNDRIPAIKINNDLIDVSNNIIILSAGAWSREIEGLPDELVPPVRPVKGQIVALEMKNSCKLTRMIRAPDVYLTPKLNGRLLVGASNEEMGFDLNPTAGEIMWLLRRGWEAIPSIYDLVIKELQVGLRPGSPDNAPLIGCTKIENLFYATGHYRHGILLTPITAYGMSKLILSKFFDKKILDEESKTIMNLLIDFQPSRFYKKSFNNKLI